MVRIQVSYPVMWGGRFSIYEINGCHILLKQSVLFLIEYVIFSMGMQLLTSDNHIPTGTGRSDFHFIAIHFLAMVSKISVSLITMRKIRICEVAQKAYLRIHRKINTVDL